MRIMAILLLLAAPAWADESFLKEGDRWLFLGDSTTHNDTYRRTVERMVRHFHPSITFETGNMGFNGATSGVKVSAQEKKPTIVSIMFGMNNTINSDWRYGKPIQPVLDAYRADLTAKAREFKALGAAVILMTPTLTDEGFNSGIYELKGTRDLLQKFAQIIREVAATEGVFWLPVQEEFEAFQNTLAPEQVLRLDGVHPSALGQYQIARTFWEHLNVAGKLTAGDRKLSKAEPPLPVTVNLASRLLTNAATVLIQAPAPLAVTATWSSSDQRGHTTLQLTGKVDEWTLPLPTNRAEQVIVDLSVADQRSVFILDFARTRVLHPTDGVVTGAVAIGTWRIEQRGKSLLFSGTVTDSDNQPDNDWPWARDGVALWLDFRPLARFADINVDDDVHMTILTVREQSQLTGALIPWIGRGMQHAGEMGLAKTPSGYAWQLRVGNAFDNKRKVDFSKTDFIGFNLKIHDQNSGKPLAIYDAQPTVEPPDKYANGLMIVDLKNKLPVNEITTAHLFGR